MRIKTFVLVAALGLPLTAAADDTKPKTADKAQPAKLNTTDLGIVAHVHHVNVMEIDMGKLAQKQGSAAAVKKYAEQLVTDHSTSDKALVAFAKTRGTTTIPQAKPATDEEKKQQQATMDRMAKLKTLKGAEFDREYLSMMAEGHETELKKNDSLISSATDPELKKMLEDRKATLQRHADGARELLKSSPQASR
jgi:putative membrane protein